MLIAQAIKDARIDIQCKEPEEHVQTLKDGVSYAVDWLADALAQDNPRFDRERFLFGRVWSGEVKRRRCSKCGRPTPCDAATCTSVSFLYDYACEVPGSIRRGEHDRAAGYASLCAHMAHKYFPQTREESAQ